MQNANCGRGEARDHFLSQAAKVMPGEGKCHRL